MSRFSPLNNDWSHTLQQIIQQPASRRTATTAGSTIGFTIVELLIVIVIIGILAAIVIVAYSGITSRANDSAVQSNLADMAKRLEVSRVENGKYPYPPVAGTGIHVTKGAYALRNNLYYCYDAAADSYAVQAGSTSGKIWKMVNGSISTVTSGFTGQGTCDLLAASLTWGTGTAALGMSYDTGTGVSTWAAWAQ